MLGCGNSKLSEDVGYPTESSKVEIEFITLLKMWEDGYRNIVNIDVRLVMQPVCLLVTKHSISTQGL
jgi:hypothetical protein